MGDAREHRIQVTRSARFYTLGDLRTARELWLVCHGYGQLAARFIANFSDIAEPGRLIVAPEGPLRFYLDPVDRPAAERRVGSSWMTREDRENDIADYIELLDQVASAAADGRPLPIVALGFSQGAATVTRWAAATGQPVTRLVLWGAGLPPDLDGMASDRLRAIPVQLVMGDADPFVAPERLAEQQARAQQEDIALQLIRYAGGHSIDRPTLKHLTELRAPIRSLGND